MYICLPVGLPSASDSEHFLEFYTLSTSWAPSYVPPCFLQSTWSLRLPWIFTAFFYLQLTGFQLLLIGDWLQKCPQFSSFLGPCPLKCGFVPPPQRGRIYFPSAPWVQAGLWFALANRMQKSDTRSVLSVGSRTFRSSSWGSHFTRRTGPAKLRIKGWKAVVEPWKTPGFLASGEEFNLGPETRLDRSELLCDKVLLKYERDRDSLWHRHQKAAERVPPASL